MIKEINKKTNNRELSVEIVCSARKYAKTPITILTTEKVIDILTKDGYTIVETLKSPKVKVGNSNIKKTSTSGTWVFLLKEEEDEKPKPKPTPKRTRTKTTKPTARKNNQAHQLEKESQSSQLKKISYSEFKNWTECPYRHKLIYVDKLPYFSGNESQPSVQLFIRPVKKRYPTKK